MKTMGEGRIEEGAKKTHSLSLSLSPEWDDVDGEGRGHCEWSLSPLGIMYYYMHTNMKGNCMSAVGETRK